MSIKFLPTWSGGSEQFAYSGSVKIGTPIKYGKNLEFSANISAAQYAAILTKFSGKLVKVGTSIDKPPLGSVGEWVKANINRSGLMSYIGAILVAENYAIKPKVGWIKFN